MVVQRKSDMRNRSTFGWVDLLIGVLFLVLGIICLFNPSLVLSGVVVILGAAAIASGISDIVFYTKMQRRIGFSPTITLVSGIISALAGIMLLIYPMAGKWVLHIVLPIWLIAHCISRIASFDFTRQVAGKAASILMLCLNILGLLLGILMIFNATLFTMSLGILVALVLLDLGISNIIEAFSYLGSSESVED